SQFRRAFTSCGGHIAALRAAPCVGENRERRSGSAPIIPLRLNLFGRMPMNRSSRLLAGGAAVIAALATGALAPPPAEAHWRSHWRPGFAYPGFYRPAFYPGPFFYPRPIVYPRPVVYVPIY